MVENNFSPDPARPAALRHSQAEPRGVLHRHLKMVVYLGAALLVVVAAVFSAIGKENPAQAKNQPPQPMFQDNTDSNAQELKSQIPSMQPPAARPGPDPDYAPGGRFFGCVPGQPCTPDMQQQSPPSTPEQQQEQQLAARERELAFESRFTSNIAWARPGDSSNVSAGVLGGLGAPDSRQSNSSLIAPHAPGEHAPGEEQASRHETEVNLDSAIGPLYVLREGTTVDSVLMNRLDGDAAGPVKVLVSNPVYSHDMQNVLIPEGSVILGEARKIGASGFGQQRRMAVVFHRMLMPDGYTVDLNQFKGLDQTGEMGLKDKVNNHYLQIFGTSIALGVIAGASEIELGGGALTGSGSQLFATGASSSISSSATTVLDRFIQIPPTITIREGHRVKIYLTQDMVLPNYKNHNIPQSF
jgi:type IV secretory pathway VirB10-like protein